MLDQENKVVSVDGVNGPEIILGSMTDVSTSGNWPTIFDAKIKTKISKASIYQFENFFHLSSINEVSPLHILTRTNLRSLLIF